MTSLKSKLTTLAAMAALTMMTVSADANGRGRFNGGSRGRSIGSSRIGNIRNTTPRIGNIGNNSGVQNSFRNRIGQSPMTNKVRNGNLINNNQFQKVRGNGNLIKNQNLINKKIGNGNLINQIGKKKIGGINPGLINKKIGPINGGSKLKHAAILKHGHHHFLHGHNHHQKHKHWGFWLGGYGGWGWGHGHYFPRRWFLYTYYVPTVSYCNPYCGPVGFLPQDGVYDYSQPINGQGGTTEEGIDQFSAAFDAFAQGDYITALAETDKAVKQMPNNADVQQFRSLVLFAMKRYRESAAVAHAALSSGRGWNWQTLRGFYPSKDVYTAQLRALEGYTNTNPKDAAGLFLLSYHYMMMGHGEAAAKQLRRVVELQPKDTLSARMLKAVDKNAVIPQQPMNEEPMTEQPMADGNDQPEVEQPMVEQPMVVEQPKVVVTPKTEKPVAVNFKEVGSWKATKEDGAVFSLTLSADGKFKWSVKAEGNTFDVTGKYELKDKKLKLNSDNGNGALEGVLTVKNDKQFELKLQYQPEEEAGLLFSRQ